MKKYASGDERSEAIKQRDKNNRGVRGFHSTGTHGTTDPHQHYHRTLKIIRAYMKVDPKLRAKAREGVKKRAKNTVSKAAPLTPDGNARRGEEDLQGSHRKSG